MPPAPAHLPLRWLLVMTATVTPAPNAGVRRRSPQVRLEDYRRALRFWLNYPHPVAERILFLENSGADLGELERIAAGENPHGREVEFLGLGRQPIPADTNYGYTEMQMLDEGLARSRLRAATTHMVKVTGRLTFPGLGPALDRIALRDGRRGVPLELMIDCRRLGFPRRGHDARVQLFACSHAFYERELRGAQEEMRAGRARLLEQLLFQKGIGYRGQPGYHLRFPANIDPRGHFGFKDRRYDSPGAAAVRGLRAALRVIAPWYWF